MFTSGNEMVMAIPIWMTPDDFMVFSKSQGLDLVWTQLGIVPSFNFDEEEEHHILYLRGPVHLVLALGSVLEEAGIDVPFACSDGTPKA